MDDAELRAELYEIKMQLKSLLPNTEYTPYMEGSQDMNKTVPGGCRDKGHPHDFRSSYSGTKCGLCGIILW